MKRAENKWCLAYLGLSYTTGVGGPPKDVVIVDASVKVSDTQWNSADGKFTYTQTANETGGTDLVVTIKGDTGSGIRLKNFSDGKIIRDAATVQLRSASRDQPNGGIMRSLTLINVALYLGLAGCAVPGTFFPQTTREKFRNVLANIDDTCKRRKIGPYLDPSDPEYRSKASLTDCDVLKVKPFDLNAELATEEGKFAYSIQLPAPLDKPRVKRADYATPKDYFEALCKIEAGDYVFDTVRNVEGIAVLRTPPRPGGHPLGSFSQETMGPMGGLSPEYLLIATPEFLFVERPSREDEKSKAAGPGIRRYTRDPGKLVTFPTYALKFELRDQLTARFAILWRGTEELNDRNNGIAGGDLVIIDRQTNKVLGVRRAFRIDEVDAGKKHRVTFWSYSCPGVIATDGHDFIRTILRPKPIDGGVR